jgi:hypothetical protein
MGAATSVSIPCIIFGLITATIAVDIVIVVGSSSSSSSSSLIVDVITVVDNMDITIIYVSTVVVSEDRSRSRSIHIVMIIQVFLQGCLVVWH